MGAWQAVLLLNGKPVHVPAGSLLKFEAGEWGNVSVVAGSGVEPISAVPAPGRLGGHCNAIPEYKLFMGRKTVFGTDCSGFTQTVYKILGIPLLRDAYQQAAQGETVSLLQEVRPGDLAFFDNPEGRITHVGIMLDEQRIIHASGKVRIDPIDNQGIVNADTGERTHQLRLIKRVF